MTDFIHTKSVRRILLLLTPVFLVFSVVIGLAETGAFADPQKPAFSYMQLMRQMKEAGDLKPAEILTKLPELRAKLDSFLEYEKYKLKQLGVDSKKRSRYLEFLSSQFKALNRAKSEKEISDVKIPQNPARFQFNDDAVNIPRFNDGKVYPQAGQKIPDALKKLIKIGKAGAMETQYLPVLADIKADSKEIAITPEMRDIAASLNNNPVAIANYVRNLITYEPYYGAKKGSRGCLVEKTCNDVDASSLLIALLRAAEIPARYEKSAAILTAQQLKDLLGVEETRTVVAALALNKIPVFSLSGNLDNAPLDTADFSQEMHLVVEWTHVQAFYEYDERGANIDNSLDFSAASTTEQLRDILRIYPKKQWIPIDPIIKPYTRTIRPVLVDSVNFNTEQFWYGFFQHQGALSPIQKYSEDLFSASGQRVENNLSTKIAPQKNFPILPPTLPYLIGSGGNPNVQINIENFSILSDSRRQQVKISLRKSPSNEIVLSRTFYGSEINNNPLNLYYEGLTDTDKRVIEQYGGIHATPSALVDIAPYFQTELAKYENVEGSSVNRPSVEIGDALILQFEYLVNGQRVSIDEKFSTAGNHEGIFVTFSQVEPDALLDNLSDPNRNSHILLEGNTALAREYLKKVQEDGTLLKKSLDHEYNVGFSRAVVTQNRILNEINGTPTTFDFKGLSIDAGAYINDYSNRGNYKTHQKDFRLLWGLSASWREAGIFEEIAGLDSISTVQGLQYAYANPNVYTVRRITSANGAEIDQLALSENTKQNMRADIAAGNTILTPDRFIGNGVWRGILYVSLRPDWTAQYAIGEQVMGNGGWTTDGFEILTVLVNNMEVARFINRGETDNFIFADKEGGAGNPMGADRKCRISRTDFLDISNNTGWDIQYGLPCLKGTANFGTVAHNYILATDGAKFSRANQYDYWTKESDVLAQIDQYIQTKQSLPADDRDKMTVAERNPMRFSPTAGTYLQRICGQLNNASGITWCPDLKEQTVYYSPYENNNIRGRVFRIRENFLQKLSKDDNALVSLLGFPESNERVKTSPYGTTGVQQDFVNGQLFEVLMYGGRKVFYTYGKITEEHNKDGGVLGDLGFPQSDPKTQNNGVTFRQNFENGMGMVWNTNTGSIELSYAANYYCGEIDTTSNYIVGKAFLHGLWDGGSNLMKGAIIFGATALTSGAVIDFVAGTHGGATITAWTFIGTGVGIGIAEVYRQGVDNVFAAVDRRIQFEFEHSDCNARKAYLLAKYVPQFSVIMLGLRDLARQTPAALKGITLTNNIFTASRNEVLPRLRNAFIENLMFFDRTFRNGEQDRISIIEKVDSEFQGELVAKTKEKGESLTSEEINPAASRNYYTDENVLINVVRKMGWEKLPNTINSPGDTDPFPDAITPYGLPKFYVVRGKMRSKLGTDWQYNGAVKVVIKDGRVYYGKVSDIVGRDYKHSQLVKGESIDGGFILLFNNQGELIKYNWWSGHYLTPEERIILLEYLLEKSGVDMGKAVKVDLRDPDIGNPNP